jgi:hypothetical protein
MVNKDWYNIRDRQRKDSYVCQGQPYICTVKAFSS